MGLPVTIEVRQRVRPQHQPIRSCLSQGFRPRADLEVDARIIMDKSISQRNNYSPGNLIVFLA